MLNGKVNCNNTFKNFTLNNKVNKNRLMKNSLIALGLTTILALGSVSTALAQSSIATEQNCGGEKCKKKKKKKECSKKGGKESSKEKEAEEATAK